MLQLNPIARLLCAAMLVVAIFISTNLVALGLIYAFVLVAIIAVGVVGNHARFVAFISSPILLALLLVWGWAMEPARIPLPHTSGISYALFSWLRIVACGGVLQGLFLPLVEKPNHLTSFLKATGLEGAAGTLIVASIIFLPEVKHRIARIIDARRAQGHMVSGIKGLLQLPRVLMPLVSSLLDSAIKRAELWSHRGVLDRHNRSPIALLYSPLHSAIAIIMALSAFVIGVWA